MSIQVRNLRKLNKNLDKIIKNLGVPVVTVQKKIAFDIFAEIVAQTPIKTGRAMNNWNISVGNPDLSVTEIGGAPGSIQGAKNTDAAGSLANLQPFSTVWISNSLPYIVFLNEGSSIQAPSGFVERSIKNNIGSFAVTT
jgi:hypothetical protein